MRALALRSGSRQTGTITHFLTGCGTGGTITGTATFLKEKNKNVHAIAIQAQKNHLLQGLRNFEESAIPSFSSGASVSSTNG